LEKEAHSIESIQGKTMPFNCASRLCKAVGALCVLTVHLQAPADTYSARVVGVSDGDTVTVLDTSMVMHKVRLSGIDAPEKRQPFGHRSKESLSDLVFDRWVSVKTDKRDRYGREVGKILRDGVDANLEQVKRGMAWHYKAYEFEQSARDRIAHEKSEVAARSRKIGLWAEDAPTPPWEFRKAKRAGRNVAQ
jgi:endonuclease YncB( thermonuclease family)